MTRAIFVSKTTLNRTSAMKPNAANASTPPKKKHNWTLKQRTAIYYLIDICTFSPEDATALFYHIFWDDFTDNLPNYQRLVDEWKSRNMMGRSKMFVNRIDKAPGKFTKDELRVRKEVKVDIMQAMGDLWKEMGKDELIMDMIDKMVEKQDEVGKTKQAEKDELRELLVQRLSGAATSGTESTSGVDANDPPEVNTGTKKHLAGSPAKAVQQKRARRATDNVDYSTALDLTNHDDNEKAVADDDEPSLEENINTASAPQTSAEDTIVHSLPNTTSGSDDEEDRPTKKGYGWVSADIKKSTDRHYDEEEALQRLRLGLTGAATRRSVAAAQLTPTPAGLPQPDIVSSRSIGADPRNRAVKRPRGKRVIDEVQRDEPTEEPEHIPQRDVAANDERSSSASQAGEPQVTAVAQLTPGQRISLYKETHARRIAMKAKLRADREAWAAQTAADFPAPGDGQHDVELGEVEASNGLSGGSNAGAAAADESNHATDDGSVLTASASAQPDDPSQPSIRLPQNWYVLEDDPEIHVYLATDPNTQYATAPADISTSTEYSPPATTAPVPTESSTYMKVPMYHYRDFYQASASLISDKLAIPQSRPEYLRGGVLINLPDPQDLHETMQSGIAGLIMCCDPERCWWCTPHGAGQAMACAGHNEGLPFVHTRDCQFTFEKKEGTGEWKYKCEFKGGRVLPTAPLPPKESVWKGAVGVDLHGKEKLLEVLICYAPKCEICRDYVPEQAR